MSKNILLTTVAAFALTLSASAAMAKNVAVDGSNALTNGEGQQADNGSNANTTSTETHTVGNISKTDTDTTTTETKITKADLDATVAGSTVNYNAFANASNSGNNMTTGAFAGANGIIAATQNSGVGSSIEVAQTVSVGNVAVGAGPSIPH